MALVSPFNRNQSQDANTKTIITDGIIRAQQYEINLGSVLKQEVTRLHRTKTYVSLFKLNYQTQPDLALEAFAIIRNYLATGMAWPVKDPRYYSPSNFLYRDQVIKLGLTRGDLYLSANLIYADYGGDSDSNTNQADFQYELWQTSLIKPDFRSGLIKYYQDNGEDNYVYKALTSVESQGSQVTNPYQQLLTGQLPGNFKTQPDLINFALVMHLDGIWTSPSIGHLDQVLNLINLKEVKKLNHRLAARNDWSIVPPLIEVGFFDVSIWLAWLLLTQGTSAYTTMLINPALKYEIYPGSAILDEAVALVNQNGAKIELSRWQQLIEAVMAGYRGDRPSLGRFFDDVKLPAKAILAMIYPELKVELGRALILGQGWTAKDDFSTIMAGFVLTSEDLSRAALNTGGTNTDKFLYPAEWAILLPWYSLSGGYGQQTIQLFINQSVRNPFKSQNGVLQVSPFLYLAAVANNLTVPAHNYRVVPLRVEEAAIVAFWLRKHWPLRVPSLVIDPNTVTDLTRSLLVNQSIVEQYSG